jgi:multiple sugar transport system permease protein
MSASTTVTRGRGPRTRRPRGRRLFLYAGLALVVAVSLGPMLYLLLASVKDQKVLFTYPPDWLPSLYFGNFTRILKDTDFPRWALNSLMVATVVTVLKVMIDSTAAYALTKMTFFGRRTIFALLLATVMVPASVLIIPLFFMVRDMNLLDTYWALILPALANPIGVFILRGSIESLPSEVEAAARVDDANEWQVFRHVILPLIRPGLVVVAVFTFLTQYTSFVWPLVATSSSDMLMLTSGLSSLIPRGGGQQPDWGLISAGSVLALVPISIVFLALQRYFVATPLAAALKD